MAHDVTVSSTTPRPTGRRNARLGQTVGDMVRSLAVVLAIVGILVLVTYQSQQQEIRTVDVASVAAQAQRQAPFELLTWPAPQGAQATSVRWEPTEASGGIPVWHVGYLVDGGEYLQISQSATTEVGFVPEQTAGGQPAGESATGGQAWQRYETAKRRSLVSVDGGVTTVVSGTVTWPELEKAAGSVVGGP
ncbi:MAG: DUF4245 family protein [Actinobacteria bacterium]|uniref:Unannotated protein n=1 Tax=freshwater metagenome TaxID=449393 RepID=A0A6J7HNA5_9ZZZZ|nr:DUF4245 family protein [Actinomycetota bacterium]